MPHVATLPQVTAGARATTNIHSACWYLVPVEYQYRFRILYRHSAFTWQKYEVDVILPQVRTTDIVHETWRKFYVQLRKLFTFYKRHSTNFCSKFGRRIDFWHVYTIIRWWFPQEQKCVMNPSSKYALPVERRTQVRVYVAESTEWCDDSCNTKKSVLIKKLIKI